MIGVLLLNLGTPDASTTPAVRRYLRQFLLDERVIDLPRALWWPILFTQVLRTRPAKSAELYRKIWTAEGSPLLVITRGQARALGERLEQTMPAGVRTAVGMRYGHPSIASAADELLDAGCDRLLAWPMYPQYSSAATGSSLELLFSHIGRRRVIPPVRVVPPYFASPEYIAALAAVATSALADWSPEHVLLSFHGYPKRYVDLGDPYRDHCHATAHALVEAMGWSAEAVTVSFQSLFGKEEWIRPYTDVTLKALGGRRLGKLAVMCPGFTADCLETLEEMGMTNREVYQRAGGGEYRLLPCLNTHPAWTDALAQMAMRELSGWI